MYKRIIFIFIFHWIIYCYSFSQIDNSIKGTASFSDNEVRYIYHEVIRNILYSDVFEGINPVNLEFNKHSLFNLKLFDSNIVFSIATVNDNALFTKCSFINPLDRNLIIPSSNIVQKMSFNLNVDIKLSESIELFTSLDPEEFGKIIFSDILHKDINTFYVGATLVYRGFNSRNLSKVEYVFQIKRCSDGFLFLNNIHYFPSTYDNSHGKNIYLLFDINKSERECD